jgi:glucose-1-phosphate adenylyltransferase
MIMAGGEGTRLSVLSEKRAKPSVPFAGKFRIIDFTLSNCVNSGIFDVAVLTQYRPHSLNAHIGNGKPWDLDRSQGGVQLLQPYQGRRDESWYKGTADAVYQNLNYIRERRADVVVLLSGDHIYKMDYSAMIELHQRRRADLTVAVMHVPLDETDRFGIMTVDESQRVVEFTEKPKNRDKGTLASMGIYVFNAETLMRRLGEGAEGSPRVDFGKHVIPAMISQDTVLGDQHGAARFIEHAQALRHALGDPHAQRRAPAGQVWPAVPGVAEHGLQWRDCARARRALGALAGCVCVARRAGAR